ncbi:MAG: metalloregulator ArsR/SmtB family transcription factor [Steroidobacteraceae bacterium]
MAFAFAPAVNVLRAAAEPTRLRLLALLFRAELTVGEISAIVSQSQPRVSRHLKLLCDAGLLVRLREQHWVYYRVPASGPGLDAVRQLLVLVDEADDLLARDCSRMEEIIAGRAKVAQAGTDPDEESSAHIDALLLNELGAGSLGAVVDVGTGSGRLLKVLAPRTTRLVGIDISSDALKLARTNVYDAGIQCELQRADMYDLPFAIPTFDIAIVDRVLATADRPVAALAEIARILKYRGRLVILDDFDAIAAAGDGNPIANVREWFREAGLQCVRIRPVDTERGHHMIAVARNERMAAAAA